MADTDKFLDDFLRDVPRGVDSRYLKHQAPPQASWQDPEKILASDLLGYDPNNPGAKILVGTLGAKLIGIEDNRHILTVAGSRSGKSVTVIGNLLHYRGSVLAIDPKGELASITAAHRKTLGQKVFVLDPFSRAGNGAEGFLASYNPLEGLRPDSASVVEDAGLIADAIVISNPQTKEPHWDDSAHTLIEGLILHVISDTHMAGQRNLDTVRRLIVGALEVGETDEAEPASYYVLEEAMLANAKRHGEGVAKALGSAIESAARDFFDRPSSERASVLSTVRRHTKFLQYEAIQNVLKSHDFNLADLKREEGGVSVYLCLPANQMGRCNRWLRIIINQLLDAMEREESVPEVPVLVCLDEFPVLGHMKQLEDAAGQIASFGVRLWVVLQDWGQGKALYGERWESFAANSGILQFFSNHDLTTTKYISELLGRTAIEATKKSEASPDQMKSGLSGESAGLELHDLLTPSEVSRQFSRRDRLKRQLVIWAGLNPMILQRVEYFDPTGPLAAQSPKTR